MSCPACVVFQMIEVALGRKKDEVVSILDTVHVSALIKAKVHSDLWWIGGRVEDPLLAFWKIRKAGLLAPHSHIIFTNLEGTRGWEDLLVYSGCKFGDFYLLVYDDGTQPGIKPSQKGLYRE